MRKNRHPILSRDAAALFALIDAESEEPPNCLGTVLSCHQTLATATIEQLDWEGTQFRPRTRIVKLVKPMQAGDRVDPRVHLAPMERERAM